MLVKLPLGLWCSHDRGTLGVVGLLGILGGSQEVLGGSQGVLGAVTGILGQGWDPGAT